MVEHTKRRLGLAKSLFIGERVLSLFPKPAESSDSGMSSPESALSSSEPSSANVLRPSSLDGIVAGTGAVGISPAGAVGVALRDG
jgi:hypothetical protein